MQISIMFPSKCFNVGFSPIFKYGYEVETELANTHIKSILESVPLIIYNIKGLVNTSIFWLIFEMYIKKNSRLF